MTHPSRERRNHDNALSSTYEESGNDGRSIWQHCRLRLESELPAQQFNTWISPLQAEAGTDGHGLNLYAPNRFVRDWVADKFLSRICEIATQMNPALENTIQVCVNRTLPAFAPSLTNDLSQPPAFDKPAARSPGINSASPAYELQNAPLSDDFLHRQGRRQSSDVYPESDLPESNPGRAANGDQLFDGHNAGTRRVAQRQTQGHQHNLIEAYNFENFVEGKSNQLAKAAASQVVKNPGGSYNPLFLYGGVGLGKTHLMHAVGNELKKQSPGAKVVYLHSERFVADMVKALQLNAINDFKRFYRSVDALLIDDIQFFANKERSQEEFFHTFNALLEGGQQMILSCDRYPKEINGVEERLKSRFGWGLTVAIEPPELETRVAILMKKAEQAEMPLEHDVAFFLAQRVRSNVRELEGALKRVIASAHFTNRPISVELIKESLKDLLALQDKQVSIENIQRTSAEYYKIKLADMMSKRRNRSVARPRQVAMALAKELTNHSLPEIGEAFGGRDHTTVLHACRKIKELRDTSSDIREDYKNLLRTLVT